MTNQNKHLRAFFNFCIQKKISHSTQEQSYGAGFALKPWSKNEPLKKFKGLIINPELNFIPCHQ
jgi:hypothetical protein